VDLRRLLAETEPFSALDADLIADLAAAAAIVELPPGATLFRHGDPSDDLFVLAAGTVHVAVTAESGAEQVIVLHGPGRLVGEMQLVSGGVRSADVRAAGRCQVLRVPRRAFDAVAMREPRLLDQITALIRRRLRREHIEAVLPAVFGPLGAADVDWLEGQLRWRHLQRGEALVSQGAVSDGFYVVVSGRLHSVVRDAAGVERSIGDVSRGGTVGELALLAEEPEAAEYRAVRDTEVAWLSREAFAKFIEEHPPGLVNLARYGLRRLGRQQARLVSGASPTAATIAVVALERNARDLASALARALAVHGSALHLDSHTVEQRLGARGIAHDRDGDPQRIRLGVWLSEQEARHRFVIYEADPSASPWTGLCLRQADHLLLVGEAGGAADPAELRRSVLWPYRPFLPARRTLVLVHPERAPAPGAAQRWLAVHDVERVHHVVEGSAAGVERLARILVGRAVGVALSGGGARALAHIGVLRALEEARIGVDLIAGTSMGSVVAALHASGLDARAIAATLARHFVPARPHRDYTLPIMGLIRGRRFERAMRAMLGDRRIEDLPLEFACISTNLTTAEMTVHRRGPLDRALLASCALPALAVPALDRGDVLVDGGLVNNLPGDVVRGLGVGTLIAVDVSTGRRVRAEDSDDGLPSAWKALRDRFRRSADAPRLPTVVDILERSMQLTSTRQRQRVAADADLYLTPPVADVALLQFDDLERIEDIGYRYASDRLTGWTPR
jgi:predicted acylesterase/phospholipase RssA/CRP-like cAMP-binding protein